MVIRYGESLSLGQAQDRAKVETRHDQPRLSRRVGGWVAKLVTFAASSAGIKGNMSNLFYSLIFFYNPQGINYPWKGVSIRVFISRETEKSRASCLKIGDEWSGVNF